MSDQTTPIRTPLAVVREMYEARSQGGDIGRIKMMALCHEHMIFSFNADPDRIGEGTVLHGWAQSKAHLDRVRQYWDERESEVMSVAIDVRDPSRVHAQLRVIMIHRASLEDLETIKRQVWIVRDGIVHQMHEVLDRQMIQTVQRLSRAYKEADLMGDI